jgi:hypothetical protein
VADIRLDLDPNCGTGHRATHGRIWPQLTRVADAAAQRLLLARPRLGHAPRIGGDGREAAPVGPHAADGAGRAAPL